MNTEDRRGGMSLKEGGILLTFLAIILFLPLVVLVFFEKSWGELAWYRPTDIAMLEWTAAFLNIFLSLLMFEHYRSTGRTAFNFIACGFLSMGILNFLYAVNSPGTDTGMWLRIFGIMTGALCFSFSIPARKKQSFDIPGAVFKFIIPTVFISVLAAWIPFSLKQILPRLLSPSGAVTLFGSIIIIVPCGFFFFTAFIWLHEYIRRKRKVDFLICIVIFIFAQLSLLMRGATPWGVLWWLWHIVWILDILSASIYMLVLSVSRSIVWKLVLSLGLAFSMTVIIASAIIQSHSEKKALASYKRRLHERHKQLLLKNQVKLLYGKLVLQSIVSDSRDICSSGKMTPAAFSEWLRKYLKTSGKRWATLCSDYGFYSLDRDNLIAGTSYGEKNKLPDRVKKQFSLLQYPGAGEIRWTSFVSRRNRWYSYAYAPFRSGSVDGVFYVEVDVTEIVHEPLLRKDTLRFPDVIVFSMKNGEILYSFLPADENLSNNMTDVRNDKNNPFIRRLTAASFDITADRGRMIMAKAGNKNFFISAQKLDFPDWGVLRVINTKQFPVLKTSSRYFFIAVGMITLLCGFIVLLVLLHRQLSKPFNRLIKATEKLEEGDFDIHIEIHDETEIGRITRAFNHMVKTLKNLYSDLAKTISEKTRALEDVKKADSAKTTFFQNISHELRTPLHGILSFARLGKTLTPEKSPEKVIKYFEHINTSGERLMVMLDSVLDLAKLESGNMSFNFRQNDLVKVLWNVREELEGAFSEKSVELVIHENDDDFTTFIDSEMIARVFRNLLGNALKMSPSDSKVEIELEKLADHIRVNVLDEGPGIPSESFNNIFDKFIQVGEGRNKGGTGLGLSICREIIYAHGGLISARNRPERGACFTFTIPLRTLEVDEKNREKRENTDS